MTQNPLFMDAIPAFERTWDPIQNELNPCSILLLYVFCQIMVEALDQHNPGLYSDKDVLWVTVEIGAPSNCISCGVKQGS